MATRPSSGVESEDNKAKGNPRGWPKAHFAQQQLHLSQNKAGTSNREPGRLALSGDEVIRGERVALRLAWRRPGAGREEFLPRKKSEHTHLPHLTGRDPRIKTPRNH